MPVIFAHVSSRLRRVLIPVLITSLATLSSSATAATLSDTQAVAYQLHMVFFSHEAGLSSVIDPQVFVSAPGVPAGVGPQGIAHAANFAPAPANDPPNSRLFNANGQDLGVTLGAWESSSGEATLQCRAGLETVQSRFHHLVPNGLYTLFIVHFNIPSGPGRFTPLAPADGSSGTFVADANGQANDTSSTRPCLTPGEEAVVLVWHSDHQTHGLSIGAPGVTSHNQLIFRVPPAGTASASGAGTVAVTPRVISSDGGLSASFTVTFSSAAAGQGEVYFGQGPGCTGLVGVATEDRGAGTTHHSVTVTGNDLPGTIGSSAIQPGTTYSFEVLTVTPSGLETDTNNRACYVVTVPASVTSPEP